MNTEVLQGAMNSSVVMELQEVRRSFSSGAGIQNILNGVSFVVSPGEWVSIMGKSGSGKTTLLRCASGLLPVSDGYVAIDGVDLSMLSSKDKAALRRNKIGFIFQQYNLVDSLTVGQNVALPLLLRKEKNVDNVVSETLEKFDIKDLEDKAITVLSGGEQQRVAIARAFASRPSIVFADEPTGALDTRMTDIVLQAFQELQNSGIAIVMVTHDVDVASCSDRVLLLADGSVSKTFDAPDADLLYTTLMEMNE